MTLRVGVPRQLIALDTGSTNVTTAAYVQLDSAINAETSLIVAFNRTAEDLKLATGAAGAEEDVAFLPIGAQVELPCGLSKGSRLSIRALTGTAAAEFVMVTLY